MEHAAEPRIKIAYSSLPPTLLTPQARHVQLTFLYPSSSIFIWTGTDAAMGPISVGMPGLNGVNVARLQQASGTGEAIDRVMRLLTTRLRRQVFIAGNLPFGGDEAEEETRALLAEIIRLEKEESQSQANGA
ncbi:hypothetical protein G7K_4313-t1 [Saitoella complicata NRRL Y-17804]|uniref:Proteasome assembly chaperone 3 n=1 Tax=Saitoella complicata (strain BCRC 22490 / CBS 7301 / JCM 7358 / NBRC 10748 / NRRL Y-17804) TaxID=698492 RepID=A0A0E9NK12_SAICN|nr:hypothetical protein G7K_4313-t1 [Saitoella complicata NRRL Y-17804]